MSSTPTSPTSPISPTSGQPLNNQHQDNIYRATQPYKPRHDGEIELFTGDIVTNTKTLGNGWTLGQNVSRDVLGIFPSRCIQPLNTGATNASLPLDQQQVNRYGEAPYSLSAECSDLPPPNNTPQSTGQLPSNSSTEEGARSTHTTTHNNNNPHTTRGGSSSSSGPYTSTTTAIPTSTTNTSSCFNNTENLLCKNNKQYNPQQQGKVETIGNNTTSHAAGLGGSYDLRSTESSIGAGSTGLINNPSIATIAEINNQPQHNQTGVLSSYSSNNSGGVGKGINEVYEILRPNLNQQQQQNHQTQSSMSGNKSDVDKQYTAKPQKEGGIHHQSLGTFKPAHQSNIVTLPERQSQPHNSSNKWDYYNTTNQRQNSMENDVNSNDILTDSGLECRTGANEDKLRRSHEDLIDGIYYRYKPNSHNEDNNPIYSSSSSNRTRKPSPKRVRIKLDEDVDQGDNNDEVLLKDQGAVSGTNNSSHVPVNSLDTSVDPVILPNLINKSIIKQHPLISPEYNNPDDGVNQVVGYDPRNNNNGQYFTLPTPPMKRGRFAPTLPPQKPKLVVKPNHLSKQNMDDVHNNDTTMQGDMDNCDHRHGQVVNTNDNNRPPQSPRVQSSPRARVKASPRSPRRQQQQTLQNTTPIMARVRASDPPGNLQLHNATAGAGALPINAINTVSSSNDTSVEKAARVAAISENNNTIPTRAGIVTAMPQNTNNLVGGGCSNLNQQYGGSFVQDRSTSPIYLPEDSCGGCSNEMTQCNNYGVIERDNTTNECLSQSTPPPLSYDRDYYDYRSLDGMDKNVRFREHNTCNAKYKPILKQQKYGDPSSRNQHIYYREQKKKDPVIRLVFSVIAALILGALVFLWMYFYLDYSYKVAIPVAVSICIILIITFAISRLVLCTAALLFPSICTTRGRLSFLLLITGFLVAGPIKNVYFNMHEVSRSMGCSAEQAYNQSMLLLEPFDEMMRQLDVTVDNLQAAAFDVSIGLDPLDEGLEKVGKDLKKGKIQLYGTARTCKYMIQKALDECSAGISAAQDQCLGVITALGTVYIQAKDVLDRINPERWAPKQQHLFKRQILLGGTSPTEIDEGGGGGTDDQLDICESLDTVKVCNSLNNTELLCTPSNWAGEAIQHAINETQGAMHRLKKQLQFEVKSDPYYMARINSSREVYQIRQKVIDEFLSYTKHFEQIVDILKKIFPAAVLLLVYVSYLHVKHYMSKDTYDNIYITRNFMTLDHKRAQVAGNHLLPLKRYERNYLVDTTISDLSPPEDGLHRIGLCVFFIHLSLTVVCYMFDYILFWILFLIQKHGNPEIDVTGQAALENVLDGDGVIVELLDVFLIGFHRGNAYGFDKGVNQCLPIPHMPKLVYVVVIVLMYILLLFTVLLKAYMLRLRNEITGFFYPERRKQRTVHLYNVILNQRSRMPKLLQVKSRLNHRERCLQEQISFCHKMAARCAPCRIFLYQNSRCLVCSAIEDHSFRDCETERCSGVFCAQCWSDLGMVCPLCLQGMEYDDDDNYEEMEDDLQPYLRSSKIYL